MSLNKFTDILQDRQSLLVWPIVDDHSHVVRPCTFEERQHLDLKTSCSAQPTFDGLLCEEVVAHHLQSI